MAELPDQLEEAGDVAANANDRAQSDAERELVARVRNSDPAAFEQIYRQHHDFLVVFANGYVGSADVARDVVADVFVNLWTNRERWAPTTTIQTYLCGAVRNRALNALRNERFREGATRVAAAGDGRIPGMGAGQLSADQKVELDERSEAVWSAVSSLSSSQREAMMLRWRRHLPFDQIAQIMGISSAAVQMHLSRALKALRERLPAAFD